MDRAADGTPGSPEENSASDRLYDVLLDLRDASSRNLSARLATAGFTDLTGDGLLILSAMHLNMASSRALIRRLGITSQAGSQAVQRLILHGYLDNPDNPRRPALVITERGRAAAQEAQDGLREDRWAGFEFRPGDIVISTEPKSGTTWMQMICALLIVQSPSLPAPLPELSPWIDRLAGRTEIYAGLAAQRHRRFIKTHVPLKEIPLDKDVTYIVVARNPLDAAVSLQYHNSVLLTRKSSHDGPREQLLGWIDEMGTSPHGATAILTPSSGT